MQFDEYLCDISHGFNCHGASYGPSAIAELLVTFLVDDAAVIHRRVVIFSTTTQGIRLRRRVDVFFRRRRALVVFHCMGSFDVVDRKNRHYSFDSEAAGNRQRSLKHHWRLFNKKSFHQATD